MEVSFSISESGLFAATTRQNVIADNLANLTTTAFKSNMAELAGLWAGGTRVAAVRPDFTQGGPVESPNDTDLFLAGSGFFQVELDGNTAYTRDGSFHVDADGNLVTGSGYLLDPSITVPDDALGVQIAPDGTVFAIDPGGNPLQIGEIELAQFVNPAGLVHLGDNLWVEGPNSGTPQRGTPGEDGFAIIRQGFLEESNVDPAEELADLIRNNRTYQLNLRVFQTSDAIIGRAIDLFS